MWRASKTEGERNAKRNKYVYYKNGSIKPPPEMLRASPLGRYRYVIEPSRHLYQELRMATLGSFV
jgi:hypothetical protein